MEKIKKEVNVNESEKMELVCTVCLLMFGVSLVMWYLTLNDLSGNFQILREVDNIRGGIISQIWDTVCLLWGASLWFKLWVISAIASTFICCAGGGFCSLIMPVASFYVPACFNFYAWSSLVSISLRTWMLIICVNAIIFIGYIVITAPKYANEKEVSPAR